MLDRLKEWQGYISMAMMIGAVIVGVWSYKDKVDDNAAALAEITRKIDALEVKMQEQWDKMDGQVDANTKYISNVHMLFMEIKGEIKALQK